MLSGMGISCFMEVAKTLNFTQAATNLYITQQACSKHIAALEKELAFPLFIRSTRRVTLTPEGEKLYAALLRFSKEYQELVRASRRSAQEKSYHLKFGLMAGTSPSILVEHIQTLSKDYPLLHIDWVYGEQHRLAEMIMEQQLDAALLFRAGAETYPALHWRSLTTFHPCVLVSSRLFRRFEGTPKDLIATLPFGAHIQYNSTAEESYREAEHFLELFHLKSAGIKMYESVEESLAGVEVGTCFAVSTPLSPTYFSPYIAKFPIDYNAELVCAWNPRSHNSNVNEIVHQILKMKFDFDAAAL